MSCQCQQEPLAKGISARVGILAGEQSSVLERGGGGENQTFQEVKTESKKSFLGAFW